MGLLTAFAVLVHDLVGLLGFGSEKAQRDLEIVVAHPDGATCVATGDRQSCGAQAERAVSGAAQEHERVHKKLNQAH